MRNWIRRTLSILIAGTWAVSGPAASADASKTPGTSAQPDDGIRVIIGKPADGTEGFTVGAVGIPKEGIKKVRVIVQPEGHARDTASYDAVRTGNVYQADVDIARHENRAGMYDAYVIVTGEDGAWTYSASARVRVAPIPGTLAAFAVDDEQSAFRFLLLDAAVPDDCEVMVRTERQGDASVVERTMPASGSGYAVTIPASDLGWSGTYTAEAYCIEPGNERPVVLGEASFEVDGVTTAEVEVAPVRLQKSKFLVSATAEAPSGIQSMRADVWALDDKSDAAVYPMQDFNGTWAATGDIASHNNALGTYHVTVHAVLGNGVETIAASADGRIAPENYMWAEKNEDGSATLWLENVPADAKQVRFPTWNEQGGQDDLVWYEAQKTAPHTWSCRVDFRSHGGKGAYESDAYVNGAPAASVRYTVSGDNLAAPASAAASPSGTASEERPSASVSGRRDAASAS